MGQTRRKRNAKKKTRRKGLLISLAALILLVASGILCYVLFDVQTVVIEGLTRYTQESVIALSQIQMGDKLLTLDTRTVRERLEEDPFLEVLSVRVEYPHRVHIELREREPAAAVIAQETAVIVDRSGHILELLPSVTVTGMMTVRGMNLSGYQANHALSTADHFQTTSMLAILGALEEWDFAGVLSLDMSNPLSVRLIMNTGMTVILGTADRLDEKLGLALEVLPRLTRLERTDGTLDVSMKGNAVHSPRTTPSPSPAPETQEPGPSGSAPSSEPTPGPTPSPELE